MDRDEIGVRLGALLFGVGQHYAFISHLDPLGWAVQPFPNRDLEVWVVSIALVSLRCRAVALFVLSELVFQSLVTVMG